MSAAAIAALAAKAALLRAAADLINQAATTSHALVPATAELRTIARRVAEIRADLERDRLAIEVPAVVLELPVRPGMPIREDEYDSEGNTVSEGSVIAINVPGAGPKQRPRAIHIPATFSQVIAVFGRTSPPRMSLALMVHPDKPTRGAATMKSTTPAPPSSFEQERIAAPSIYGMMCRLLARLATVVSDTRDPDVKARALADIADARKLRVQAKDE